MSEVLSVITITVTEYAASHDGEAGSFVVDCNSGEYKGPMRAIDYIAREAMESLDEVINRIV